MRENTEYLKKRYVNPPILVIGDFNNLEEGTDISNFKKENGFSGLLDESSQERPWIERALSSPTCKKRRIDYPIYSNVNLEEVTVIQPIGNSDHKSLLINPKMCFKLESEYISRMSKKFLTNKLQAVDLDDFSGIDDYVLLSRWLESKNVPLKITKRNFFTASQRFLTNILTDKNHEETLTKVLNQISKARFKQVLESISELSLENKTKEMHQILQTVMKLKNKAPILEGITNHEGLIVERSKDTLNSLLSFFKNKYEDLGTKYKFIEVEPPCIKLSIEELDFITKRINKHKGNGFDYIPLTILNMPHGKKFILSSE